MSIPLTELERYMEISYNDQIAHTMEQAVKLKFPLIENLSVENEGGILNLSFTGGATKEEVELFLKQFQKINR